MKADLNAAEAQTKAGCRLSDSQLLLLVQAAAFSFEDVKISVFSSGITR